MNKNNVNNQDTKRNKNIISFVFTLLAVIVFVLYLFKLFSLQIIEGRQYKIQSKNISSRITTIPAQRGEIYDRNNDNAMVVNSDSFAVELTPGEIPAGYFDTVASRLANILNIPKTEIDERVPPSVRKTYVSYTVKNNVNFSVISDLKLRICFDNS